MTGRNGRAMTVKLTPAQIEAFYGAYKAYRDGKGWNIFGMNLGTRKALERKSIIISAMIASRSAKKVNEDIALPLAIELGFPARYDAEKRASAAKHENDEAQQMEYRKLLEIPDTIAAPHIVDNVNKWVGVHYWTIHFSKGITIRGRVSADDDSVAYRIDINNVRLETTADITAFQREMFAAFNLFTRLQRDLKGKVPTYEPSARAILPGKGIGEQS